MSAKPTPDELLEAIRKEEISQKKGKLKIFFGMCAGVGKTYAMLQEAHHRKKEGIHVVVGIINTHSRKDTEDLVHGLPIITPKKIPYRGSIFEEFDLDAVLQLKPQLALVDELAHTNIPGARHRKRWQDVEELLDAGIDVFTTLNVQHIESRKGLVESIAEIPIRETVPDSILERANSIEFIDLPPEELLQRLKEGKVYTGELSQIAIAHFFKVDNLTALREIALRLTAEKVEHDLHGLLAIGGRAWKTREKLLVAINSNPESEEMIRTARKKAFEMDAPWICLYVDTEKPLTANEQERLKKYLSLARDLGAEVLNIKDVNIAAAINQMASQKDVTQVILGRTTKTGWFHRVFQEDLVRSLERENKNIDILIVRQNRLQTLYEKIFPKVQAKERVRSLIPGYLLAVVVVAVITGIGKLLSVELAGLLIGFLFLLGILFLSFFTGIGEVLFAAILSSLSIGFLFTTVLSSPENIIFMIFYFIIASTVGVSTTRLRREENLLKQRQDNLNRTIEIERQMGAAKDLNDLKNRLFSKLITSIPGEYEILTPMSWESKLPLLENPNEMAIATWVLNNGKMAGWSTNTLSSAQAIYLPIKYREKNIGVFVYQPAQTKTTLSQGELDFLQNILFRLGIFIERFSITEEEKVVDLTNQIEKMHQGILQTVSRGFNRPIDRIFDSFYKVDHSYAFSTEMQNLFEQTVNSANDLKIIIDNILMISELESGRVSFQLERYDIHELVKACRLEIFSLIKDHEFILDVPPETPNLPFDFRLMKSALKNILINALQHSPEKAPIKISLILHGASYSLSVIDEGPGISSEVIPLIFTKFYQVPTTPSPGIGIGLAIVKSIVDLHKGSIVIDQNKPKGTIFTVILPL